MAEPLAALLAFLGWSLAMPGTPLAAHFDPGTLLVVTVVIATIAAFVLLAAGKLVLTKKVD